MSEEITEERFEEVMQFCMTNEPLIRAYLEQEKRKAFEAGRKHPDYCDRAILEIRHHTSPGNSAGRYPWLVKINYEFSDFADYEAWRKE